MPFITQGKNNFKYVLILAVLSAVLGGLTFVSWQKIVKKEMEISQMVYSEKKTAEPEKPAEPINTDSWQTYRNEKYGFEFRYPGDWHIKQGETAEEAGDFFLFDSSSCSIYCVTKNSNITLGVKDNQELLSVQNWVRQNVGKVGIESDQPFSVGESFGIKREYKATNGVTVAVLVMFPLKGKLDPIYYFEASSYKNMEILNQILLEFRFLK